MSRWITTKYGAKVFIQDGQSFMDAFIKQKGGKENIKTNYNSAEDGKLTRNKFKEYLDNVKKEIEYRVDNNKEFEEFRDVDKRMIKEGMMDYDNTLFVMRNYGYGMKDVSNLEFIDERGRYEILATFNDGMKIVINDVDKY